SSFDDELLASFSYKSAYADAFAFGWSRDHDGANSEPHAGEPGDAPAGAGRDSANHTAGNQRHAGAAADSGHASDPRTARSEFSRRSSTAGAAAARPDPHRSFEQQRAAAVNE